MAKEEGVWRTIRGRRVFIKEGETAGEAVKRSKEEVKVAETSARKAADLPEKGKSKTYKEMSTQERRDKLFDDILEFGPDPGETDDPESYQEALDDFLSSGYLEDAYGTKIKAADLEDAIQRILEFQWPDEFGEAM